jgi:hypothetical protein
MVVAAQANDAFPLLSHFGSGTNFIDIDDRPSANPNLKA